MRSLRGTAVVATMLTVTSLILVVPPRPAAAAAPTRILNEGGQNSGDTQWVETQSVADTGSTRAYLATFLVEHGVGRRIVQAFADLDFDAAVNATTSVSFSTQTFGFASNVLETSRVTVAFAVTPPDIASRADFPIRFRLVDDFGGSTQTVSSSLHVADASNSDGFPGPTQDYPRLTSTAQSTVEVVPGSSITYIFTCEDVDINFFSADDDCDRANIRWRRLNDGEVSSVSLKTGLDDNVTAHHTMSFPARGYYVVEAQLGNEDGLFPDISNPSNGWWRLGNAVVNETSATLCCSLTFPGANPSVPPSINEGSGTVNAVTAVADTGGTVQVIEWDSTGDAIFERREYTVPVVSSGNLVHPLLSSSQLAQSVSTASPGLLTVRSRITDNGAFDAADNIRRQRTFSTQLRVNARPTASSFSVTTAESTPTSLTMLGSDGDNQPAPLTYEIVTPPLAGTGTLGAVSGNQVTFTPAAGFSGSTSFTYRVRDGGASTVAAWAFSNVATVDVTVTPLNNPPSVDPKFVTTAEDTPVDIQATGSDVEGPLTWSVATQPTSGSATCHMTTGLCTYTPGQNFFGNDSFVVRGTDSEDVSATATFSVTVNPVNDAPIADDQSVMLDEDATSFAITLTGSDVDDASLTFTAPVDDVDHGTLSCIGDACTYTPAPDFNGSDSFTFDVSDGSATDLGTIEITVTPVNDAPVATDVADGTTDEDVTLSLTLGGTDVDGDPVTVTAVSDPSNGTATIQGPNAVDYVGDANFHGIDTFEFTVTDGQGGFDPGTVVVTVAPVNDAPTIDDQTFDLLEDAPGVLSLVAGDVDGDVLSWSIITSPSHGVLSGAGPDVEYSPDANFNGTDSFEVSIDDGNGGTDTATITLLVAAVNDAPVAEAAAVTTEEDVPVEITLGASDVDGDPMVFTSPVVGPSFGTLICTGAVCTYTPALNFHGLDQFTFQVDDGNGGMDTTMVSITITPVNDLPVAADAVVSTTEDTAVSIFLVASDIDADPLTFTPTEPSHGILAGSAPNLVYVPDANYHGSDTFQFTVADGAGGHDTGLIEITVTPVNDAPVATGGSTSTPENTPVTFQLGGTDVDGDALTFTATPPDEGILTCSLAGSCHYAPASGFVGTFAIGYEVSDGVLADTGAFVLTVVEVFHFSGFLSPVDNRPTVNRLKAGAAVPVKFSLGADEGLNIFAAGYPRSQVMTCGSTANVDAVEETVTAGSSSLSYDAGSDTYTYVWKTESGWKNTCRQLVLVFRNGDTVRADFMFVR